MAIDGEWDITISTPMGDKGGKVALRLEGTALVGTMTNEFGETPIKDGAADGNALSWKSDVTQPFPMTLAFDVDVDGDSLVGSVKFGPLGEAPVKGTRA